MPLLLSDGRVQLVQSWIVSRSTATGGSGNAPTPRLLEWHDRSLFELDVANGNVNSASYVGSNPVPGFVIADSDDEAAVCNALIATGGMYTGAAEIPLS